MGERVGLVWLVLAACDGKDDTSEDGTGRPPPVTDTETDTETGTDTGPDPLACVDEVAEGAPPLQLTGTTVDQLDDGFASCGGGGGQDYAFLFTAPTDSDYVFDTLGSLYDPLLAVFDGCGGPELGCDDDSAGDLQARVRVTLAAGQQVVLWVDGYNISEGEFVLNVVQAAPAELDCSDQADEDADALFDCLDPDCASDSACTYSCPDEIVSSADLPFLLSGSTVGRTNDHESYCGEPFAADSDSSVSFQAQTDGRFVFEFDPDQTDFEAVLTLYQGCGGSEIYCVGGEQGRIVYDMDQGESVLLVVDGVDGSMGNYGVGMRQINDVEQNCTDFVDNDLDNITDCQDPDCDLEANCVEDCADALDNDGDYWVDCADGGCALAPECEVVCPERSVEVGVAQEGSTIGLGNEWEPDPSCTDYSGSDITFEFVAPADGTYVFSTAGSSFDTVLHLWDDCLATTPFVCNDDIYYGTSSEVQHTMLAGEVVIVVVDGFRTSDGDYVLNITEQ